MPGLSVARWEPGDDVVDRIAVAASRHEVLDFRSDAGGRVTVPAHELRRACIALSSSEDPFGVRIANAVVEGKLDLSACSLAIPLQFLGCAFGSALSVDGTDAHDLTVVNGEHAPEELRGIVLPTSELPGLLANGLRLRRDLNLSGTHVTGRYATSASLTRTAALWLSEASIGGRLLAVGTVVTTHADRAIQADHSVISGGMRLVEFQTDAEVRLIGLRLGGSLDLTAATLDTRGGRALDLGEAAIVGSVFIIDDPDSGRSSTVNGRVEMGRAKIEGDLLIRRAALTGPPPGVGLHDYGTSEVARRAAIVAPGLTLSGRLYLESNAVVDGGAVLPGARLEGGAILDRVVLRNATDVALDLSQAVLGSALSLRDGVVEGTFNLAHVRISGPLAIERTEFRAPAERRCVIGVGARVEGDIRMVRTKAIGGSVNFRGAVVAGVVDAEGATLVNPGDRTLGLHQSHVQGNVRLCKGFSSHGMVVLNRAIIDGRLRCDGGTFDWSGPPTTGADGREPNLRASAVEVISAVVAGGVGLDWHVTAGGVDFTDTRTSFLADRPASDWPNRSYLAGFTYLRFAPVNMTQGEGEWDPEVRARWLSGLESSDVRPWEQAARVLRENGDVRGAERLLIAARRSSRSRRVGALASRWRRCLDLVADLGVRYGYRPERALYLMAALIVLVAVGLSTPGWQQAMRTVGPNGTVYSPAGPIAGAAGSTRPPRSLCSTGEVRCFSPVVYAIDTVVPIIDLKQRSTWYPSSAHGGVWLEWWLDLCTVLGWLASTVFVLSLARLSKSNAA